MRPSLLAACLSLALAGCRGEAPEVRIRKAFEAGARAVEAGDAGGAAAILSPKFTGPEGLDRAGARLLLEGLLRREKAGVTVLTMKIDVTGPSAVQTVDVLLTGRTGGGLLPEEHSRKAMVLRWELRDGRWLVRELQWD